LIFFF
jgi:hypothetical protein